MKKNIEVGDIVILKTNNTNRNEWPMAWVIEKIPDKDGLVRSVKLHIECKSNSDQTLIHPITKLVLLFRNEDVRFPNWETRTKFGCDESAKVLNIAKTLCVDNNFRDIFYVPLANL